MAGYVNDIAIPYDRAILVGTIRAFRRLYYGIDGNLLEDCLQVAKTILEGAVFRIA